MKAPLMLWEPITPPGNMTIGAARTANQRGCRVLNEPVSGESGTYVPVRQDRSFVNVVSMSEDPTSR